MAHARFSFATLSFFFCIVLATKAAKLPIYIEDSHAGSFGFFAQNLDLEKEYTLILFDAHSDASGIPASDRLREKLRRVNSIHQRRERIQAWRNQGIIQPFNWIEPLMPKPIKQVIWVAADSLTDAKIIELQTEARIHLDWQTQAEPRKSGNLASRFIVTDWQRFKKDHAKQTLGASIVSVDLDYFAGMKNPADNLREKWQQIMNLQDLHAISIALSRPWLKSDLEAETLLLAAFQNIVSVRNAKVHYEPFLTDLKDRSEMAKSFLKRKLNPPRYDIAKASRSLKQLLLQHSHKITVKHNQLAWRTMLRTWEKGISNKTLILKDHQQSTDQVWRLKNNRWADIWIDDQDAAFTKIKWWLYQPSHDCYNLIPNSGLGKGFTGNASRYIVSKRKCIAETTDPALSSTTWKTFLPDVKNNIGIVRIQAEIISENGSEFTDIMEIRVRAQDGFLGALEEQFGSPYVFGIGKMQTDSESGPETLLGNDCANFPIYAWRRNGHQLPWSNPTQLLNYLEPFRDKITRANIETGVIVHLGSHVTVLYQDRGVIGKVDELDHVLHHLSGTPTMVPLGDLLKGRKEFQVMRLKNKQTQVSILFGGDVNLFGNPLPLSNSIKEKIHTADAVIANLECVISDSAKPVKKKRFNFIVPSSNATRVKPFTALSLANNHAGDGGEQGLKDTIAWLEKNNIQHFGAGTIDQATAVKIVKINGVKIGFIGLNCIETDLLPAGKMKIGIASYPRHKSEIAASIQRAKQAGIKTIIAMPHWGNEYASVVTDQQRKTAAWLIRQGVTSVIGAHPHILQQQDFYQGRRIVYSLGNLIFYPSKRQGFNERSVIELKF